MKKNLFSPMNLKSALVLLCFGALSLLTAGNSEVQDRTTVSAGDRTGLTDDMQPIFGSSGNPKPASDGSLNPADAKGLLSEFRRAQATELKAFEHRNKLELSELKSSHSSRIREWEKKEKELRRKFFAEHLNGPDRRAYIQNFRARHDALEQELAQELAQRTSEQSARAGSLRADQAARMKEFKEFLDKNERPPARLWPSAS